MGRVKLKGRVEKYMTEGGRTDTCCLLGFEAEGRKRRGPSGLRRVDVCKLRRPQEHCDSAHRVTVRTLVKVRWHFQRGDPDN